MLVDWERISLLADPNDPDDQAWLSDTLKNLALDLNQRIENLNAMFQKQAWEDLKSSLHQMRGVTSNFGLAKMTDLSTEAENLARNSNFSEVGVVIKNISKTWMETKKELQKKFQIE